MQSLKSQVWQLFSNAFHSEFPELADSGFQVEVTPSTNDKFGHYQCNSAMRLAKPLKKAPRDIAQAVVNAIEQTQPELIKKLEVAGPGFINVHLSAAKIGHILNQHFEDTRLGVDKAQPHQRVVIDFSSPNTAKEMHVGHLRSTIIGDTISRVLEFKGHDVLRINHIGDWGTAFGMLIAYIKAESNHLNLNTDTTALSDLMAWYRAAKKRFDEDAEFKKAAQNEVVHLQSGQKEAMELWQLICNISKKGYQEIYDILNVKIIDRGESFYNPYLAQVIEDFEAKELITLSEGAKCVYLEGFQNRDGDPLPFMIQKSDGGFNYATTDLAALKHRIQDEKANRLIYVIDAGQSTHMSMLFKAAEKVGYLDPNKVDVHHVAFGLVLGQDGKKFRTRSGETEKLIDLLNTAIDKAKEKLLERQKDKASTIDEAQIDETAHALGINAVKYADLSCNRTSDYMFSYEKMLQFEGNTAAFLMYSYVRVCGIKRKLDTQVDLNKAQIELSHPSEVSLAVHLCQFAEVVESVAKDLYPNRLCEYLYECSEKFNAFFRDCRVIGEPEQDARLKLCEMTAKTLELGMGLLGLRVISRM